MAGKGSEIGGRFEEIAELIRLTDEDKRAHVGVCLDTCHISDGGYHIADDTDAVLDEFDRIIGLDRLRAIHLNDSKNPLGAKKDRHEKIGDGHLGLEGITNVITNPRIMHLPFYLETPNELDGYAAEISLLRGVRNGL
jgi:deoxyribonuclease-4